MPISLSRCWVLLLASLVPLAAGCGGNANVLRVTGTVRSAGKPVPNLLVHFVPEQGRPSWGSTDEQGAFELSFDRKTKGALRGRHKVFVTYRPRDAAEEMVVSQNESALPAGLRLILKRYSERETTLQVEITKEGQVVELNLD
jgi:hypothetical protein